MSCYINYTLNKSKYFKPVFQIPKIITMLLFSNSIQINIGTAFSEEKKNAAEANAYSLHSEHLKESPHSASFKIATLLH